MKKGLLLLLVVAIAVLSSGCVQKTGKAAFFADYNLSIRPGNEPFLLKGTNGIGVLLIHGFSASPHEVRELAEYLNARGYTVYAPLLTGHGTNPEALKYVTWQDWEWDANNAYDYIKAYTDRVVVGGVSLGGALAIHIATKQEVEAVISIGSPIYLQNKMANYAYILQYFIEYNENKRLTEEQKQYYYYNRSGFAIAQFMDYVNTYSKELDKVTEPILILQAKNDVTIEPTSAQYIYNYIGSGKKELVTYQGESHVILDGPEKDQAIKDIYNFIEEITKSS